MRQPPSPPVTAMALVRGSHTSSQLRLLPVREVYARMPARSRAPFVAGFFTFFLAVLACCAATAISGSFSLASWLALSPAQISEWASSCLTTTPTAAVCTHQKLVSSTSPLIAGVHFTKNFEIVRVPTVAPSSAQAMVDDAPVELPAQAATTARAHATRERETERHRTTTPTAASGTRTPPIRHDD